MSVVCVFCIACVARQLSLWYSVHWLSCWPSVGSFLHSGVSKPRVRQFHLSYCRSYSVRAPCAISSQRALSFGILEKEVKSDVTARIGAPRGSAINRRRESSWRGGMNLIDLVGKDSFSGSWRGLERDDVKLRSGS